MVKTLNSHELSNQQNTGASQDDLPPPLEESSVPIIMTNRKSTSNFRYPIPRRESSTPPICSQFIIAMLNTLPNDVQIKLCDDIGEESSPKNNEKIAE